MTNGQLIYPSATAPTSLSDQQLQQQQQQSLSQLQQQQNGFLDFSSLNNFYDQNHVVTVSTGIDENGLQFYKTTDSNALYATSTPNGLPTTTAGTTMNFSNCTTPQTPSSIPDIVLTGEFFPIYSPTSSDI